MAALVAFFGSAALLTSEGALLLALIARGRLTRLELWSLGFPLGVLTNTLLFFACTIAGWPLSLFVIFALHGATVIVLALLWKLFPPSFLPQGDGRHAKMPQNNLMKVLIALLLLSIAIKLFYGISHAFLPTLYYDSLSQWTLRAKISFFDHTIAFDPDFSRGISKPQYPILLHSLQIFFMLLQGEWSDLVANTSTLLLSLTSFLALFFLMLRRTGIFWSTSLLALLLMVPLSSLHLAQGHGDLHLVQYLLLSAFFLHSYAKTHEKRELLLSALFCAGAAWVKQEGFFFGVLPWITLVGAMWFLNVSERKHTMLYGIFPAIFFGAMWTAFLLLSGMKISPHGEGIALAYQAGGLAHAFRTLFASGSFGIYWYIIPLLALVMGRKICRNWKNFLPEILLLMWGVFTFSEAIVIYLFTPNVQFLLNGQGFSRTMLIPLFLLILGCVLLVQRCFEKRHAE